MSESYSTIIEIPDIKAPVFKGKSITISPQ